MAVGRSVSAFACCTQTFAHPLLGSELQLPHFFKTRARAGRVHAEGRTRATTFPKVNVARRGTLRGLELVVDMCAVVAVDRGREAHVEEAGVRREGPAGAAAIALKTAHGRRF